MRTFTNGALKALLIVVLALVAALVSVQPVEADTLSNTVVKRLALDFHILCYAEDPVGKLPPRFFNPDAPGKPVTAHVSPDAPIKFSISWGKSPEVRGRRTQEKNRAIVKYRPLGSAKAFEMMDMQDRESEKFRFELFRKIERGKELTPEEAEIAEDYEDVLESLRKFHGVEKLSDRQIREHLTFVQVMEGEIPVEILQRHRMIHAIVDSDHHREKFDFVFVVQPGLTFGQMTLFDRAPENEAARRLLEKTLPGSPALIRSEDIVPNGNGAGREKEMPEPTPDPCTGNAAVRQLPVPPAQEVRRLEPPALSLTLKMEEAGEIGVMIVAYDQSGVERYAKRLTLRHDVVIASSPEFPIETGLRYAVYLKKELTGAWLVDGENTPQKLAVMFGGRNLTVNTWVPGQSGLVLTLKKKGN